jgi:hypothetical protein
MSRSVRLFCGALALIVVASLTAGCQVAKAGAKCRTTALAHDQTYILKCVKGRWTRAIPTQTAINNIVAALNRMKATTTTTSAAPAAPVAESVAPTTTTTEAPTTTSIPAVIAPTTTTTMPATTTTTTAPPPAPKTSLASYDGANPSGGDTTVVGVSDDGRYVVYDEFDDSGITNAWKRDTTAGTVTKVTVTNNGGNYADGATAVSMTPDARYVAFLMDGTLFVRDTTAKTTGQVGPTATATTVVINAVMSADGASVAYLSNANGGTNGIFSVFQSARVNGKPVVVSVPPTGTLTDGVSSSLAMTPDGHYVVFDSAPDPTTLVNHLYRRDLTKKTTVEVGLSSTGAAPDGLVGGSLLGDDGVAISADGNVIAFDSDATNLIAGDTNDITDIYVRNVSAATTVRASVGTGDVQATSDLWGSVAPVLSADGRYVLFTSQATNLVPNAQPYDVYIHDLTTGITTTASVGFDGVTIGNGPAQGGQMSSDGRYVAFSSQATNLVTSPVAAGAYYETYVNDRGA